MNAQARAIVWAQFRSLWNYFPKSNKGGLIFGVIVGLFWYGMWCVFGAIAVKVFSDPGDPRFISMVLSGALLLIFLYWQVIPVLMATAGASLEIRKLRVYPIPHTQLFLIEVLLRITAGIEMMLLLAGIGCGLLLNPRVPAWGPLSLVLFIVFNLCVAAGAREILTRVFARKRIRELAVFLLVLCGALPQLLVLSGSHSRLRTFVQGYNVWWMPWTAVADVAQGLFSGRSLFVVIGWTALAYFFGRWQFERGLSFDADAQRSTPSGTRSPAFAGVLFRWPTLLFPDPLAALIEKEIRFLSRAPRFRLVFVMGFTFGLVIWLPIAGRGENSIGALSQNYLTLVCVYALLLLGDVCFWNTFGFDRRASQIYFVAPVRFAAVLIAKNITALFFVLLEITAIIGVCALLRMPITAPKLIEAYSVTLVITIYLVSVGNLTSTHNPRAVNPEKSMRTGAAGQMQALLVLVYPVAGIPVFLAYAARYAFRTEIAFYVVLVISAAIGAIVYWVAMDSAVGAAERKREQIVDRLSQGEGLIQA